MTGRVLWWNRVKGYGFIVDDEGSDIFVHYTSLLNVRNLCENSRVSFKTVATDNGMKAIDVEVLT